MIYTVDAYCHGYTYYTTLHTYTIILYNNVKYNAVYIYILYITIDIHAVCIFIYIYTPIEPQHVEELNMFLIELTVGLMAS